MTTHNEVRARVGLPPETEAVWCDIHGYEMPNIACVKAHYVDNDEQRYPELLERRFGDAYEDI